MEGTKIIYIDCLGVDDKKHVCKPDSVLCKCGVPVKRKTLIKKDWLKFGCYECTY